ncbi:DNA repair protein [Legionella steigerwaltii]|uniref:DNA repair protein n=1 Tax=Legionella steigerwaltii TaxID=460 RepID=A0A378LEG7_9GAMM|nr:hypothetical protein [Legionella steigerwaltii]KTD78740.1 DNA repair protein [Legionella steigerwaltii]STY24169.1 DNA repair protein [Legionella steigerwaltii]
MWYLKIMRELLSVLPEASRKDGRIFLNKLFFSVEEITEQQTEIEFFLGLIEKSFLKFERKEPGSVSLTEFCKHILGLTLLYVKSSDDLAIWNSDFVPALKKGKIKHFLILDKKERAKISSIRLLNKIEMDTFASLEHTVNINFEHLRIILNKYHTTETAQFFIKNYSTRLDGENCCGEFKLLVQDAQTFVDKQRNQILPPPSFSTSHRLSIFQPIIGHNSESAIINHTQKIRQP